MYRKTLDLLCREDRIREQVGEAPPRLEERKGTSEYFFAFALLHAGCGDEVIEARLDKRTLACWCLMCDELRIIGDPMGRDNGNLPGQGRVPLHIVCVKTFTLTTLIIGESGFRDEDRRGKRKQQGWVASWSGTGLGPGSRWT